MRIRHLRQTVRLTLALALLLLHLPTAHADFNDGVVAYLMGDYDKAFTVMQSLAESTEHGYAQYYLGMMYLRGQGAEQSDASAGKWFRRAAKNRISQAQYKLGKLYMKGRGVPKDNELAYAWLLTATKHQHQQSMEEIGKAQSVLSVEEAAAAEKLGQEFIEKYGPQASIDPSQPIQIDN